MVKTSWGQQFVSGFGTNVMSGNLGILFKNWMQKMHQRVQIFCIINFLYYLGVVSFEGKIVLQQKYVCKCYGKVLVLNYSNILDKQTS